MKQQNSATDEPPYLVYAGDVPVQSFCHGSSLIYRLLMEHPPERLLIVETSWIASEPDRRIPGVRYVHHRPWWTRAFFSPRLARFAPFFALLGERAWRGDADAAGDFPAQRLLSVAHGFNWLGVSEWARRLNIPLKLILHDDWPRPRGLSGAATLQLDAIFSRHYRGAQARLCVSAFMEETYRKRYGVGADVLYPSRDGSIPVAAFPQPQVSQAVDCLRVAFAGTLHPGYERPLKAMLRVLETMGGRLVTFGPFVQRDLDAMGLSGPHVEHRGLLEAGALQKVLCEQADILYAPMSFEEADRANTEVNFPSKLTDYTACGLPVLIHAPSWSSGGRWVVENPDSALVVDSPDEARLADALHELQSDAAKRVRLAEGAIASGSRCFSAEAAATIFRDWIIST